MKVYVAASSQEMPRASAVMKAVREAGHQITHDWVEVISKVGEANPATATVEEQRQWADEDLDGAYNADVLVLLAPNKGTGQGSFTEFGFVLGLIRAGQFMRKTIVVRAPNCHSIFQAKADVFLNSDAEVVGSVRALEEAR